MPTIRDVAKYANVSISTVSKYFHHPDTLSPDYKERVQEAVLALKYSPNPAAQSMRTRKTNRIALVVPQISNQHFIDVYYSMHAACLEFGYTIITYTTDESTDGQNDVLQSAFDHNTDGVILAYADEDYALPIIRERKDEKPVLMISAFPQELDVDCIALSLYEGICKTTEHLISLGHKRIAFCGGPRESVHMQEKERGFLDTMRLHKLDVPDTYMTFGYNTALSGYQMANRLLSPESPPSAIVAANDILAIGCIKAVRMNNLRTPQDIAVSGFDGIQMASLYEPGITTFQQPTAEMGRMAVKMLIERIKQPRSKSKLVLFNGELKVRKSTSCNSPILLDIE